MRKRERSCAYNFCTVVMAASLSSEDKGTVERTLNELLNQECGSDADCKGLLGVLEAHPKLGGKVAEVLASFAKEDAFRDVAVSCAVVPALCPLLTSDDIATRLHTLRAIGNLCYDHDGNRELVLSSGGCPLLVNQLMNCTLLPTKREYDRLKCVSCGCLFNVINDNTKLCEEMLSLKAVEYLSTLLATPGESDTTIDMGLKPLFVLITSSSNQPALLCPNSVAPAFSHLLGHCVKDNLDMLQSLLETMEVAINISDDVKVAVIEAGCLEKLVQIAEPSLQVKAVDILILICANDSSLKLVSEKSAFISTAEQWLKDPGSLKRQANTALLFANMARTDEMCELFVARGVVPHLIKLIETEEPEELSGKIHVSGLSALRNLCIPASQKPVLLEKGVLKVALKCLRESQWPHVHFKSLGIARLLADQQGEACRELVVSHPGTVTLVCEQCSSTEHPQVRMEGSRLMAALIKHSKSEEVMRAVVSEGGVKLMTALLDSEHMLLRNEALVSLNLLAALGGGEEETATMLASLTEEAVLLGVWGIITDANSSHQLLANSLTLLLQLVQSDPVDIINKLDGFDEKIKGLTQHSSEAVRDKAKALTQIISDPPDNDTTHNN